jgi:hypothetical protein
MELFRPRKARIRACDLGTLIVRRKHGISPEQLAEVRKFDNDELVRFRTEDPISATECQDGGLSLTGGHHRTHEIDARVTDGYLRRETIIEVLLHD